MLLVLCRARNQHRAFQKEPMGKILIALWEWEIEGGVCLSLLTI